MKKSLFCLTVALILLIALAAIATASPNYQHPPIPSGFKYITGTWDTGYVIQDQLGNQWVWVPVGGINGGFTRRDWSVAGNLTVAQTTEIVPTSISAAIVNTGGFYVARYEMSKDANNHAQSKANKAVWNFIDWSTAQANSASMGTDLRYPSNVLTHLIYDTECDTIMKWLSDSGVNVTNSVSWGNYVDDTLTGNNGLMNTGANTSFTQKNISDMAGNVWEWNQGVYSTSRVYRGGGYNYDGGTYPAAYRTANTLSVAFRDLGFRVAFVVQNSTVTRTEVKDLGNNGDARDIRVMYSSPADETPVQEYRIYVVKTSQAGSFTEAAAAALPSTEYVKESTKGKNRLHLLYLTQGLQDSDGDPIQDGVDYTIFVLNYAKAGYAHVLNTIGTITLAGTNTGAKVEAATPAVIDIANNNNGTDLRVIFKHAKSELNIQEYRIIASTADLDLAAANSVAAGRYKAVAPTSSRSSYVVTLDAAQKDQTGADIQNGTPYKVYILAVGKNGYDNVLSTASKFITLSPYVPGAPTIRGLRAVHVGEGSDSSNIKVIFYEPIANSRVQEYRIFLASAASTLDEATAESAASGRYQTVSPTRRGALHSVTLDAGLRDYAGDAVSTGMYKVYVLTVGKSGSASRLSAASGNMELP